MNCPCSVLSRPKASPLLRDVREDFLGKGDHPNVPGQAQVKFAHGDEHELPFPCNPKEIRVVTKKANDFSRPYRMSQIPLFEGLSGRSDKKSDTKLRFVSLV
jgi:hypothetical protein